MLFAATFARAEYKTGHFLASCADVECPTDDQTIQGRCQVTNRIMINIGMESFSLPISKQNLTWTVGIHDYTGNATGLEEKNARKIEKYLYLGTPEEVDLTADDLPFQGCAVILYNTNVTGPTMGGTGGDAPWDCNELIGQECYNTLLQNATEFVDRSSRNATSTSNVCNNLQEAFANNYPSACIGKGNNGRQKQGDVRVIRKSSK